MAVHLQTESTAYNKRGAQVGIPAILSKAGVPQSVCQKQIALVDVHQTVIESSSGATLKPPKAT